MLLSKTGSRLAWLLAAAVVLAPVFETVALQLAEHDAPGAIATRALASLLFTLLPLALLPGTRAALAAYLPIALLSCMFTGYVLAFGKLPPSSVLLELRETVPGEFREFFWLNATYVGIAAALLLLYVAVLAGARDAALPRRARLLVLAMAIGAFALDDTTIAGSYPLVACYDAYLALNASGTEAAAGDRRRHHFTAVSASGPMLLVVVIGESARYENFGINGYRRPTTPHLAKLPVLSFGDVAAASNATYWAVPLSLTRATPAHLEPITHEKSLVALFGQAGFHTAWLSEQEPFIDLAADAQHVAYVRNTVGRKTSYDRDLLPLLDQQLGRPGPQAVFLHTYGSHVVYSQRYDPRDTVFGDAAAIRDLSLPAFGLPSEAQRQTVRDAYDNTIAATDRFLADVYARLQGREALLVYYADHGENLWDDERHLWLHGLAQTPSRREFHVPLLMLPTPSYAARHPQQLATLKAHRDLPTSTTALFYTLPSLAGVRFAEQLPTACLDQPTYQPPPRRDVLPTQLEPRPYEGLR